MRRRDFLKAIAAAVVAPVGLALAASHKKPSRHQAWIDVGKRGEITGYTIMAQNWNGQKWEDVGIVPFYIDGNVQEPCHTWADAQRVMKEHPELQHGSDT